MINNSIRKIIICCLLLTSMIISKQKDIFLWDIHDVILVRDSKKTFKILWEYNNKKNLFTHCNSRLFKNSCSFLWRYIINDTAVAELIDLAIAENNNYLVDFILQIASAYQPIYGTWEIIKELYDLDYTHHVASNISKHAFEELINRDKHPSIAPIFTYFDLHSPQVVYTRESDPKIIKKPSRAFFEEYLKKHRINLKTTRVLFIDDNKDNIIAAASMGFVAILFTTPEQLRIDLRGLGIPLNAQPVPLFGINHTPNY